MEFETLKELWKKDSIISKNLDQESLNIPQLHSKWYNILIDCKIAYKREELAYNREKIKAQNYYSGDYNLDDKRYVKMGPQPKKLKTNELDDYCKADSELQKIILKKYLAEEKIEFILNILSQINSRSFQISNAIKWQQFMNGING